MVINLTDERTRRRTSPLEQARTLAEQRVVVAARTAAPLPDGTPVLPGEDPDAPARLPHGVMPLADGGWYGWTTYKAAHGDMLVEVTLPAGAPLYSDDPFAALAGR